MKRFQTLTAWALGVSLVVVASSCATAADNGKAKNWLWIPAISYGTDTGWMAGSMIYRFYGCEGDSARVADEPACRRSSISAALLYTQKQQLLTKLGGEQYWAGHRHRFFWAIEYREFPTVFYGIGRLSTSDQVEDFTPRDLQGNLGYTRRLSKHWELGGQLELGTRDYLKTEPDGLIESGVLTGGEAGSMAGAGLLLIHDSRDSVWFPLGGHLHSAGFTVYRPVLGGDYDWERLDLNLRQYLHLPAIPGEAVLALQVLASHVSGDAPFYRLSFLGGENELRGYPGARWRDNSRLLAQAELRSRKLFGPLGAVFFIGYGDVAPEFGELDLAEGKLGWGGGLRYLFDPETGLNLRMDMGRGEDGESNMTITIGEAF